MNIKDAAFAAKKINVSETRLLQLFRQTGGARIVVSHRAVSDDNHRLTPGTSGHSLQCNLIGDESSNVVAGIG